LLLSDSATIVGSSKVTRGKVDDGSEAARRLGVPVCEVCGSVDCERKRHGPELNAVLCMRCYVDWLKHEVAREVRESGEEPG